MNDDWQYSITDRLLLVQGPVSLLMARHCRLCVGIEATPSSVQDARENARINNIQNVEFISGRVEQVGARFVRIFAFGVSKLTLPLKVNYG